MPAEVDLSMVHMPRIQADRGVGYLSNAWAEMVKDGSASKHTILFREEDECIYAVDLNTGNSETGSIVGAIVFTSDEVNFTEVLSYISPEYRRKGVYTQIWQHLMAKARKRQKIRIFTEVRAHNRVMNDLCEAHGRELVTKIYSYDVGIGLLDDES